MVILWVVADPWGKAIALPKIIDPTMNQHNGSLLEHLVIWWKSNPNNRSMVWGYLFCWIYTHDDFATLFSSFSASLSPSLDLGDCEGALCRNVFFPAFVYMWLKPLRLHLIPLIPIVCITPGFFICSHTQISFNPKSIISVCTCNSPGKQSFFFLDLPRNSISSF